MSEAKREKILVIDYGVGNHLSIINALNFLGYGFHVSDKIDDIRRAPAYILPGVGAFAEAMNNLEKLKIVDVLSEEVLKKKKPILGICLGMQLLAEDSEEKGFHKGLGWIKGHVVAMKPKAEIRIPHVGWNSLKVYHKDPLFERTSVQPHFYFDHSYHFVCDKANISSRWS